MNDESRELINDYVSLCGRRTEMEEAKTLPERFKATLWWQGDLAAFVIKNPAVLSTGVMALLDPEARKQVQAVKGWRQ